MEKTTSLRWCVLPAFGWILLWASTSLASQTDINGPAGSGAFGTSVTVLPNGNFVVTDPMFDLSGPTVADVGAVYLYSPTGTLISTLTGSTASDQVGSAGIVVLANGNFVVRSPLWDSGSGVDAGAVTWGSGTTGFIGGPTVAIASGNSLIGTSAGDTIGDDGDANTVDVFALSSGNYVVRSPLWDNVGASATDAGAVTWGDGSTGTIGLVTELGSLTGGRTNDRVGGSSNTDFGKGGVVLLTNGNYVVISPTWRRNVAAQTGAVTWGDGDTGVAGPVSDTNSLVGPANASGHVGSGGVFPLSNGNYAVRSPSWVDINDNEGAVTLGNGSTGTIGDVDETNSLIGSNAGSGGVFPLTNGNYVVVTPGWNFRGAVTWCSGTAGFAGMISETNSLVGRQGPAFNDEVGYDGHDEENGDAVIPLTNGNYVVVTPSWDGVVANDNYGAATWCDGTTGRTGFVTAANSLVGANADDQVGLADDPTAVVLKKVAVVPLSNGNYVVRSTRWTNGGASDAGAVTWGNGTTGTTGTVSAANSLVGTTASDMVGRDGVFALANGNYVVASREWNNGATPKVGAITWGNGSGGTVGAVSASNSLVGAAANEVLGFDANAVTPLTNGNYVVRTMQDASGKGAVSWCDGSTGKSGVMNTSNSLIGANGLDRIGSNILALTNGDYVVISQQWDNGNLGNGGISNAGAISHGSGSSGLVGLVTSSNSLVGTHASDNLGNGATAVYPGGRYAIRSGNWDNGATTNVGAITFYDSGAPAIGPINANNSYIGTVSGQGATMVFDYNTTSGELIIGQRAANKVTRFTPTVPTGPEIVVEQPVGMGINDGIGEIQMPFALLGGSSTPVTFTVKNVGTTQLSGLAITKGGTHPDDFTESALGATFLAPGASTTFTVTFTPGGTTGNTRNATIHLASNDTDEDPFDIALEGSPAIPVSNGEIAVEQPAGTNLADNTSVVNFGNAVPAGQTKAKTFTVKNRGTGNLTGLGITIDGPSAGDYSVTANPVAPVAPGGSTTFTVTFDPSSLGPRTATMHIASNDANENPFDIIVTGTGVMDTVAPLAPTITAPAANALLEVAAGGTVNVTGTATDERGVKQVQVALNGGAFTDATLGTPGATSTTYSLAVTPVGSPNTVQVKTIDFSDQSSTVVSRTFRVARTLVVNVNTTEHGSVTAGYSPDSFREVGRSYTIAATPKVPVGALAGGLFTGWTVTGATNAQIGIVESAKQKQALTFIFREGMQLTANFIANPFRDMAGSYNGLIRPSETLPDRAPLGGSPGTEDGTALTNATEGKFQATVQNTGAFSATLTIDGLSLIFSGAFDQDGHARFGTARLLKQTVPRAGKPSLIVSLDLDMVTPGTNDKITGIVKASDFQQSVLLAESNIEADRAFYNGTTHIVPGVYLGASNANGIFTAILPVQPEASQPAGIKELDYPQGISTATIIVTKAGAVTVTGTLSDGSTLSASSAISQANTFPLFAQLYSKLGFISGFVQLDNAEPDSDMAGESLQWLRPFQGSSHHYPDGWRNGIRVDLLGARYAAVAGQSVLKAPGGGSIQTADADGNATLSFTDGSLSDSLNKAVNLSVADVVAKVPNNDATFTLTINRTTGMFNGLFDHTDDTKPAFSGIVYQKGPNAGAYGYFLTKQPVPIDYTGQSGGVVLIGQ